MPPTRGATTESAAITGIGRGRCRVFTRSTPIPKSCPPDRRVQEAKQLVDANNQHAPQIPLADGASKARTQEAKRHKKVSPSSDPARDQGFPRRIRAESQEHHHARRLQGGHDAKKASPPSVSAAARTRLSLGRESQPRTRRRGPARPPSPSRTQTATNRPSAVEAIRLGSWTQHLAHRHT